MKKVILLDLNGYNTKTKVGDIVDAERYVNEFENGYMCQIEIGGQERTRFFELNQVKEINGELIVEAKNEKESSVMFFAHFKGDKKQIHKVEHFKTEKTPEDLFEWIVETLENERENLVLTNCGIIR